MIEIKNLTKRYGNITAVDNISITLKSGKIYGLLGPNGAGKSTTMNIVTGCLSATEGDVIINGENIYDNPLKAKQYIGYLPETPPLYVDMTPYEYLRFVASAKKISKNDFNDKIEYAIAKTGLDNVRNRLIKNLSKGYMQRVGIAQAILGDPEYIILDEPTVGLDPSQMIEIRELIKELGSERTVILSSHILSEISNICDEVLVIAHGKLVANDTPEMLSAKFTADNILNVQVRTDYPDTVYETISGIEGIEQVNIISITDENTVSIEVNSGKLDIRDELFYEMARIKAPVIGLSVTKPTLEQVFIELTAEVEEDNSEYVIPKESEDNK